jgi:hypothetical protein
MLMNFKGLSIAVFFILLSYAVFAQDKIFKSNGEVIDTRIRKVGSNMIIFVRYDNPSGPEYTIPKREVDKIKYQNGSEEVFNGKGADGRQLPPSIADKRAANELLRDKYGSRVIAIAPIQFTENGLVGISASYEKAIDKNDIVSFYLPAIIEFNNQSSGVYGAPTNPDPMFYLMPGIKLYPTGGYGIAKYAVGPSLVIADGQKTTSSIDNFGNATYTVQSHFLIGMMINQSININPTPHLYIGSELGMGFTYINRIGGLSQPAEFLVQFGFKIGYRY